MSCPWTGARLIVIHTPDAVIWRCPTCEPVTERHDMDEEF